VPRRTIAWSSLVVLAAGCPQDKPAAAKPPTPSAPFVNRYPADISLPSGIEYPCAVTALPGDLVGIPDEERNYINHVYAVVIDVVRAKQILLTVLGRNDDPSLAHMDYQKGNSDALRRLRAEPVPAGLEGFHQDVIASIELHRAFFDQAVVKRTAGATMPQVHEIPEGHQASEKLMGAWNAMNGRYGEWSPAVKDSVYHHLCALDLF
jgi:hypothetical protein